ncbi:MAG: hypothetical protein ACRD3W_00185 [Terriglobales bacterium]
MYAEITAAFQSGKTAVDLIKATKELSNSNELLTAVNDVQIKLSGAIASALSSQEKQALLAERVRELETQLKDSEDWKNQMQRYKLFEFPTRALAYQLKRELANGEPVHYPCTACADKKKKTILQPISSYLHCPEAYPI